MTTPIRNYPQALAWVQKHTAHTKGTEARAQLRWFYAWTVGSDEFECMTAKDYARLLLDGVRAVKDVDVRAWIAECGREEDLHEPFDLLPQLEEFFNDADDSTDEDD